MPCRLLLGVMNSPLWKLEHVQQFTAVLKKKKSTLWSSCYVLQLASALNVALNIYLYLSDLYFYFLIHIILEFILIFFAFITYNSFTITSSFWSGRLRTRLKRGWVWWSAPSTNCCSPSACYMTGKVSADVPRHRFLLPLCHQSLHLPTLGVVSLPSGEFVAQFKFTVLLMANGSHRITSGPFDPELYKSDHEVQDPQLKVDSANSLDSHELNFARQKLALQNIVLICNLFVDFTTKLCKP